MKKTNEPVPIAQHEVVGSKKRSFWSILFGGEACEEVKQDPMAEIYEALEAARLREEKAELEAREVKVHRRKLYTRRPVYNRDVLVQAHRVFRGLNQNELNVLSRLGVFPQVVFEFLTEHAEENQTEILKLQATEGQEGFEAVVSYGEKQQYRITLTPSALHFCKIDPAEGELSLEVL